jgi:hypothetical protein
MLTNKIRTAIIALVTSAGIATVSALPAVSEARPILKTPKVTCPDINGAGVGQPGEQRTLEWNAIQPNGTFRIEKETKVCGSDGKWHTVVDLVVTSPTTPIISGPVLAYAG